MRPDQLPAITSQSVLHQVWCHLMGELGFSRRQLWVLLVDVEGRTDGRLMHLEQLPDHPDSLVVPLMRTLAEVAASDPLPGTRAALLLARPGLRHLTAADRAWGRALVHAAHQEGVGLHPLHVASDQEVVALTGDDLAA